MDRKALFEWAESVGLPLSDSQLDAFESYEEALYEANTVQNLTRVAKDECWLRHFVDSLLFQDLIPEGATVLDVGTGPGLPAWPLANARPDLKITAIDSNGKMLNFLRSQPLPNLEVIQGRAEEVLEREKYDVVTGRAVAPLPLQLELSAAPLRVGGRLIPMRTSNDSTEGIRHYELSLDLRDVIRRPLPGTDIVRVFPFYLKAGKTAKRFPRRWAEMKAKPL